MTIDKTGGAWLSYKQVWEWGTNKGVWELRSYKGYGISGVMRHAHFGNWEVIREFGY